MCTVTEDDLDLYKSKKANSNAGISDRKTHQVGEGLGVDGVCTFLSSCYLLGPEPHADFTKDSRSVQLGRQGPLLGDPGRNPRGGPAALRATRIFHGTSAGCFKLPPL